MELHNLFSQAYILGGSPCSGKSTAAERLAAQFDLRYYKVDDHEREHARRCNPEEFPVMTRVLQMSWNENFSRPADLQVEEEFAFYRERFKMILEDLQQTDTTRPLILEGAAYLPELLSQHGAKPEKVLFMIPTFEFQVYHYRQRPWIQYILRECANPEQAFENWMVRDHLFGQEIVRQAEACGYRTVIVDGRQGIKEQYESIRAYFNVSTP